MSKALELADRLNSLCVAEFAWPHLNNAATELRRLAAEVEALRAALAQAQSLPADQDAANLLSRFERQAHRMGELWERCQGKGWPEKEGVEFDSLRDEKTPATRAALIAMLAASPAQPVQPSEPVCERCEGSGEALVMEGRGPDTYELLVSCPECKGTGEPKAAQPECTCLTGGLGPHYCERHSP